MVYFIIFCFLHLFKQQQIIERQDSGKPSPHEILSDTFTLKEVTVTALENRHISTSSLLGFNAIEHTQPFVLANLMQLLPGGLTPAINLHTPQYFSIRSLSANDYDNTLGTGIWVDGARISNNANLQLGLFPGQNAEYGYRGIDTRQLSLDNIESVEVIRGIPSVRYGDITSGAVLVRKRIMRQPLTFNLKITDAIKTARMAKGWHVGSANIVNLSASYTQTYQDPRSKEKLFRQTDIEAFLRRNPGKNLLNLRLAGNFNLESSEGEKDQLQGEYVKSQNHSLSANLYGTWNTGRKYLSSLDYRAYGSYAKQKNEQRQHHIQMGSIGTYRIHPGEDTAFILPSNYFSLAKVEGIPIDATASITGNFSHTTPLGLFLGILGIEWNSSGNRGRGRMDDPARPSGLWLRPRSYREIPFMHTLALFLEEKHTIEGRAGILQMENGLRLTQVFTRKTSLPLAADPRMQLRYTPHALFTLKAGWGRLRKLPTLAYLFPAPFFQDRISYRYSDPATGNHLTVLTTDRVDPSVSNLSLPRNDKTEMGIVVRWKGMEADVTVFYEHLHGGFSLQDGIRPSIHRTYQNNNQPGNTPAYHPSGVVVNGVPVPYASDTTFMQYQTPGNQRSQKKKGVEFVITPGKLPALASTLIIDGAYTRIEDRTEGHLIRYHNSEIGGKSYPYAAIFENTATLVSERLSTNFRFVTQLPSIRFVSSLTFQAVWLDRNRKLYESHCGNPIYMKDENGSKVEGNIYSDRQHNKYVNPLYYMDIGGQLFPFTQEMATDKRFSQLVHSEHPLAYLPDSYAPYFLINLRITKEIGRYVKLTFYANNIAGMHPSRLKNSTGTYVSFNPSPFHGLELQFNL